jgi:hypothetical protein
MNPETLSKKYRHLTPEERFRLILAASGRGDNVERDRLARASQLIDLRMEDYAPYAHAFDELATFTFLDLFDHVARLFVAIVHATIPTLGEEPSIMRDAPADPVPPATVNQAPAVEVVQKPGADPCRGKRNEQKMDWVMGEAYVVQALANGWKLFCEEMNVPPFVIWQTLPGFAFLQNALTVADKASGSSQQYLDWLNSIRPKGTPALLTVALTAKAVAAFNRSAYRERVQWWGGREQSKSC